jgi:type IV fimbrial biogenesis protein FimT
MSVMAVRPPRAQSGFTLIEAMIAIAVMTVLVAIAVPSYQEASLRSQLRAAANDLVASVHLARSEAIKRNTPVTMCASSDGEHCATSGGWEQGWIIRSDTTLRRQSAGPSGLRITAGSVVSLTFQPSGGGATAAAFRVCRGPSSVAREERVVTIDATGRPWTRTASAVCS